MRRTDRERGQDFAWDVLKKAPYATLSMTDRQGRPYAVPVNQAVDEEYHVVYFHCAGAGEKWELLKDGAPVCLTAVSHAMLQLCSAFDPKGMGRFMECVEKNGPATRVIRITPQELTGKENTAVEKHHHHHHD